MVLVLEQLNNLGIIDAMVAIDDQDETNEFSLPDDPVETQDSGIEALYSAFCQRVRAGALPWPAGRQP